MSSQGRGSFNNFQFSIDFLAGFSANGLELKVNEANLGPPTYPVGLSYKTGAILARIVDIANPGQFVWVNCDIASGDPLQQVPVAILFDSRLPATDNTGATAAGGTVVGTVSRAIVGAFTVESSLLFATLLNLSDVSTTMDAWKGVSFNPTNNTYSKF